MAHRRTQSTWCRSSHGRRRRDCLGDGLGALELRPALTTTVLIGRHGGFQRLLFPPQAMILGVARVLYVGDNLLPFAVSFGAGPFLHLLLDFPPASWHSVQPYTATGTVNLIRAGFASVRSRNDARDGAKDAAAIGNETGRNQPCE
jgi:hypothetical protein